jgi:hypothetical protein
MMQDALVSKGTILTLFASSESFEMGGRSKGSSSKWTSPAGRFCFCGDWHEQINNKANSKNDVLVEIRQKDLIISFSFVLGNTPIKISN